MHVTLTDESGRVHHLDPTTVEVIEQGVLAIDDLEHGEPLKSDPGWRRITDLNAAIEEGLVSLEPGDGISWGTLFGRMRMILAPLVEAGWEVIREEEDEGEDDCVVSSLRRGNVGLSVDHYPDGWTLVWECDVDFHSDELESTIQIPPDSDSESARPYFEEHGWLTELPADARSGDPEPAPNPASTRPSSSAARKSGMYNGLDPLIPTPAERDEPDGTTAWSDEVGLPGEPRLLAWTVFQETTAKFDIHVLWDTPDIDAACDAALLHGQAFFGPNLTGGTVFATLNSADNGIRKRFGNLGWITKPF